MKKNQIFVLLGTIVLGCFITILIISHSFSQEKQKYNTLRKVYVSEENLEYFNEKAINLDNLSGKTKIFNGEKIFSIPVSCNKIECNTIFFGIHLISGEIIIEPTNMEYILKNTTKGIGDSEIPYVENIFYEGKQNNFNTESFPYKKTFKSSKDTQKYQFTHLPNKEGKAFPKFKGGEENFIYGTPHTLYFKIHSTLGGVNSSYYITEIIQ